MSKPDLTRHGTPRIRCVNCGRPVTWWLGTRWKHAAGGSKPQPKCSEPKPVKLTRASAEEAARLLAKIS